MDPAAFAFAPGAVWFVQECDPDLWSDWAWVD